MPCGPSNEGSYFDLAHASMPWTTGVWQHFTVSIQTNADQSATITLTNTDTGAQLQATDFGGTNPNWSSSCATPGHYPSSSYPPISTGGYTGVRGDYTNFTIGSFTVSLF